MKLLLFKYYQIPPEKRLIIDNVIGMTCGFLVAVGIVIFSALAAYKYLD